MDEKFDKAIDLLISQFKPGAAPKCDDALKFSQAVLNLTHAKVMLAANAPPRGKPSKPGES